LEAREANGWTAEFRHIYSHQVERVEQNPQVWVPKIHAQRRLYTDEEWRVALAGNDRADQLAKRGLTAPQQFPMQPGARLPQGCLEVFRDGEPTVDLETRVRRFFMSHASQRWIRELNERPQLNLSGVKYDFRSEVFVRSRNAHVLEFLNLTASATPALQIGAVVGQIQHGADTFWGQAFPNPQWRLCDAPEETLEHILNQCPALDEIRLDAAAHVLDSAMQIWEMATPLPNFLAPQLRWRFPPANEPQELQRAFAQVQHSQVHTPTWSVWLGGLTEEMETYMQQYVRAHFPANEYEQRWAERYGRAWRCLAG
jgi:hypothetical protein